MYLVIFGSIIVAAYKMGMVHERPRVITRNPLNEDDSVQPTPQIDPSTVVEIRDERTSTGIGNSTTTQSDQPGASFDHSSGANGEESKAPEEKKTGAGQA